MLDKTIEIKRMIVKERPNFRKIPIMKTIGAKIVQKICSEIICFVRKFLCLKI